MPGRTLPLIKLASMLASARELFRLGYRRTVLLMCWAISFSMVNFPIASWAVKSMFSYTVRIHEDKWHDIPTSIASCCISSVYRLVSRKIVGLGYFYWISLTISAALICAICFVSLFGQTIYPFLSGVSFRGWANGPSSLSRPPAGPGDVCSAAIVYGSFRRKFEGDGVTRIKVFG